MIYTGLAHCLQKRMEAPGGPEADDFILRCRRGRAGQCGRSPAAEGRPTCRALRGTFCGGTRRGEVPRGGRAGGAAERTKSVKGGKKAKQTKSPASQWWGKVDSNHRSRRQQIYSLPHLTALELSHMKLWSWWTDSNPRPADYKSAALPAELHQQFQQQGLS